MTTKHPKSFGIVVDIAHLGKDVPKLEAELASIGLGNEFALAKVAGRFVILVAASGHSGALALGIRDEDTLIPVFISTHAEVGDRYHPDGGATAWTLLVAPDTEARIREAMFGLVAH